MKVCVQVCGSAHLQQQNTKTACSTSHCVVGFKYKRNGWKIRKSRFYLFLDILSHLSLKFLIRWQVSSYSYLTRDICRSLGRVSYHFMESFEVCCDRISRNQLSQNHTLDLNHSEMFAYTTSISFFLDSYNVATWMLELVTSSLHETILRIDFTNVYLYKSIYIVPD